VSRTPSKQAGTIRYYGPGSFETIQCFSQQLNLAIFGDQAAEEELMDSWAAALGIIRP
jgi:hypothetical protein